MQDYPRIQVTNGMSGWFAVMLVWNPEFGGFPEPECTGVGRYAKQSDAIIEARSWAEAEGLPFFPPTKLDLLPARQDVEQQMKELIPGIVVVHLDKRHE
jgi:hypothetical protein